MNRRTFFGTLVGGLLAAPLAAGVQPADGIPRIGVLVAAESATSANVAAFRQALHDLGYIPERTVTVEYAYAHGHVEIVGALIAELVRHKVDVLVVGSGVAALEAKKVTQTIPIVVVGSADPVGSGLVESLARPGGNVTGLSLLLTAGITGKWVELIKEAVPNISHVGYLRDTANPLSEGFLPDLKAAAQALGLRFQRLDVRTLDELDRTIAAMAREPRGALIVNAEPLFLAHPSRVPELAAKYRLPTISMYRVVVDAGGLMSYGPSLRDLWRRAAVYVDRLLNGAQAADLPVERPTKFELIINQKTAKALGLTIPQSLLLRADELIQ